MRTKVREGSPGVENNKRTDGQTDDTDYFIFPDNAVGNNLEHSLEAVSRETLKSRAMRAVRRCVLVDW